MGYYLQSAGAVASVNGRLGAVVLTAADVGALGLAAQAADSAKLGGLLPAAYQAALGFTPINKAGDAGIGNLSFSGVITQDSPELLAINLMGGNLYLGKYYKGIFIGNSKVGDGTHACTLGWVYDPVIPVNSFFHITPYGQVEGNFFKLSNLNASFGQLPVAMGALNASGPVSPGAYTVATLPAGTNGAVVYATNGRKAGEGLGLGTGSLVVFSAGAWRRPSDETVITA